jgi:hypothetical protein
MIPIVDRVALARAATASSSGSLGPTHREGPRGLSAFQVWLDSNPGRTEEQFFESLRGPQGPPGIRYEHLQLEPLSIWTVNHNLGLRPQVKVLSVGGIEMLVEVIYNNTNQVLIYLDSPKSGLVICS